MSGFEIAGSKVRSSHDPRQVNLNQRPIEMRLRSEPPSSDMTDPGRIVRSAPAEGSGCIAVFAKSNSDIVAIRPRQTIARPTTPTTTPPRNLATTVIAPDNTTVGLQGNLCPTRYGALQKSDFWSRTNHELGRPLSRLEHGSIGRVGTGWPVECYLQVSGIDGSLLGCGQATFPVVSQIHDGFREGLTMPLSCIGQSLQGCGRAPALQILRIR